MIPNWADAADVLQETTSVMWRKFEQFELGTNFFAWACQIARFEVQAFRKRHDPARLILSDEFIQTVAIKAEQLDDLFEQRQVQLLDCMNQLRERDRDILRFYYFDGNTVEEVAGHTQRTIEAVYKALQRIRQRLFECIENSMSKGRRS